MTDEHDRLERELAALRPVEPSAELAERIGKRLGAQLDETPSPGRGSATQGETGLRGLTAAKWLVLSAIAAGVLVAAAIWLGGDRTQEAEMPLDLPQPTLTTALDETLPSVWTFRPALESSGSLEPLLDKHTSRPSADGENVQTRGFDPVTMNLNSRLGEL